MVDPGYLVYALLHFFAYQCGKADMINAYLFRIPWAMFLVDEVIATYRFLANSMSRGICVSCIAAMWILRRCSSCNNSFCPSTVRRSSGLIPISVKGPNPGWLDSVVVPDLFSRYSLAMGVFCRERLIVMRF